MKLVKLPRYVRHSAYRDASPAGSPAVHAMRRGPELVVDVNAFLNAEPVFSDAFYPDEPDGQTAGRNMFVSAWFGKGGTIFNVQTKASELARVLGRGSIPDEWFGR